MRLKTCYIKFLFISYSKLQVNIWLAMMFYLYYRLLWYITWNLHDDGKNIFLIFLMKVWVSFLQSGLENGGGGRGWCWTGPGSGVLVITLPFDYLRCSSQEKHQRKHEKKKKNTYKNWKLGRSRQKNTNKKIIETKLIRKEKHFPEENATRYLQQFLSWK